MVSDSLLMLPDHPSFQAILATNPPPGLQGINGVGKAVLFGTDGMPRPCSSEEELIEYLLGGEYDEVNENEDFLEEDEGEWL